MGLNVFFDTETLTVNRKEKPALQKPAVYVVSCEYYYKKHECLVFPTLKGMLDHLIKLKVKNINLIAHNGEGYDNHFLRRELIDMYAMQPQNQYIKQAVDHSGQVKVKDIKGNYMLESRVKSKTRLDLQFRINGVTFKTIDTYPIFNASVRTIGELLEYHGVIDSSEKKLDYDDDYTKYDKDEDMSFSQLRNYCLKVYNQLSQHALDYVGNDSHVIYMAYRNFDKLFPNFDVTLRTLSMNIKNVYTINKLANLQIQGKYGKKFFDRITYTEYNFDGINFFDYAHRYYKGGLNFYNDRYVCKPVHNLIHLDINSSYPSRMRYKNFPTYLVEAIDDPTELVFDDKFYYFIEISKSTMNMILKNINSKVVRQMFCKYFNNPYDYVYLQTPVIDLLGKFIGKKITELPVKSYLKWESRPFGAKEVIEHYYSTKTQMKKDGCDSKEVYTIKVILNGIYGIPALRARYNLFQYNSETGDYFNKVNGFKNSERNIIFASAVTSYALQKLLTPLTFDIKGVDNAFIYADTDSLFLRKEYYNKIKDNIKTDPYKLGYWGIEHEQVDDFYILNHKKYALHAYGHNEVYAGGIPKKAFDKLDMPFNDFIKYQFHDGSAIKNLRNMYTKTGVITLYEAQTLMQKGSKYSQYYDKRNQIQYSATLANIAEKEEQNPSDSGTLYYETPVGAISPADAFPVVNSVKLSTNINRLIQRFNLVKFKIGNSELNEIN